MKSSGNTHILFISPGFPSDEHDTTCIPALQLYAKSLNEQAGIKISVIATHYPYEKKQYTWNGIEVLSLRTKQNMFSKISSYLKLRSALKELHKKKKIRLIHCFWLNKVSFIANDFSIKNKIPLVITLMGQDARANNRSLKKINSLQAEIIALSEFHDSVFKKNTQDHSSKIIHWGIENIDVTNIPDKRDIDLICAGGFSEVKNLENFIEIAEKVRRQIPGLKVKMIGGGLLQKEIEKTIAEKQLNHFIDVTGMIPRQKVLELMKRSKVMLHTSHYESFGLVLTEGLACGCKVISYPVGIAPSIKNIQTGKTTEELISLVIEALGATEIIPSNQYLITDTTQRYLDLYESSLNKKP